MSIASDDRLVAQVTRELSMPEPGVHLGVSLVVATIVASPALLASLAGRLPVPTALVLYLVALVVVWVLAGLVGSALAATPRARVAPRADDADDEPSPPAASDSVGSDSAH